MFKPSRKLTELFAWEVLDCGNYCTFPCERCTKEAERALMYAAELTLDDAMPDKEEDPNPATWASAEFEIAAHRLMSECIAFSLPSDKPEHHHDTSANDAYESLRILFRRIEAQARSKDAADD